MTTGSVETVLATLKDAGFRMTAARMAIVEAALSAGAPVSARDIVVALSRQHVRANITTVYRELEFLREQGVLTPVSLIDGVQRYEPADLDHHHHLICLSCERIQDVVVPHQELHAAERQIEHSHNFTVMRHALDFYGQCSNCR